MTPHLEAVSTLAADCNVIETKNLNIQSSTSGANC
jgi:hypothetical protein